MLILCIYDYTNNIIYQCDKEILLSKIAGMILLVYSLTEDSQQFQVRFELDRSE